MVRRSSQQPDGAAATAALLGLRAGDMDSARYVAPIGPASTSDSFTALSPFGVCRSPNAARRHLRIAHGPISTPKQRRPARLQAMSVLPEPRKTSRTTSPERELFVSIALTGATGFEVGWSGDAFGPGTSKTEEQSLPPYQPSLFPFAFAPMPLWSRTASARDGY